MALDGNYDLDKDLINAGFLNGKGSVSVGITAQTNATAVHKIRINEALGQDEFIVDNVEAKAGAQASGITFLNGSGSVGFQASGDLYSEMGVFPDPTSSTFMSALGPVADTQFTLPKDPNLSTVMLRWGANASASGQGSIALGAAAGNLDFSAGATGESFFCVLQQVPRTTATNAALAGVVKAWRMPVQVRTANDLAPRTHLLAEVGGSLTLSISSTFGHEFNWIRQISDGPLTGDIGLKLQLGLTAAFDLNTQGKYAVVVSRETDAAVIRIRIYKLKVKGFDFALSASVAATGQVPAPENFDGLVQAVLGVHALQILNELQDPNAIDSMISKFGTQYVSGLMTKLTGMDLATAIAKVNDLASRWKMLPSRVAGLFVKLAEKDVPDFSQIRQVAQLIAAKDGDGLETFLESKIQDLHAPLLNTPLGQYLEALGEKGGLALVQEIPDVVQKAAQKTVDVLNGAPIEALLNKFVCEIDRRLGVDAILADLQGDPTAVMDKLLFSKLESFLGRTPVMEDIRKLQSTIRTLREKADNLYSKAITALTNTYTAQLNATYEQTTTDTALVDASFDFSTPGDRAGVVAAMQQLLAGKLDDFLSKPRPGITLANGALTHQIQRHSHVDLTLPFLKVEGDWSSTAMASFNAIDQDGGRLTVYRLNETGTEVDKNTLTSLWKGRNWRSTSIAITGQVSSKLPSGTGLRIHANTSSDQERLASTTCSIRMEVSNMSLLQLEDNIEPFSVQFMRKAFPNNAAFEKWAETGHLLEKRGNTLVALDVALPGSVPLAWLSNLVRDTKADVYRKLSLKIQVLLRRYLRDAYFRDINRYRTLSTAYLVLLYAAIPPENEIKLGDGRLCSVDDGIYWDVKDLDAVRGMVTLARDSGAADGFKAQLDQAKRRLTDAGRNAQAKSYDTSKGVGGYFAQATSESNLALLQNSLLLVESKVISGARNAALDAANFNELIKAGKPLEALKALADFGNKLAEAFNADLSSLFVDDNDALQRLSPLIFAQVSSVFDEMLPTTNFDSTLNVTVLKPGVAMPTDFPDFTVADEDIQVSLNAASFGI